MSVLSVVEMKKLEQNAVDRGMGWFRLMENAGSAAAAVIRKNEDLLNKNVVIFCGTGNNGGDGFVVARKLNDNGAKVSVFTFGDPATESSMEMNRRARSNGIKILNVSEHESLVDFCVSSADIIVDAIFGTGFHSELPALIKKQVEKINCCSAKIYSLDVPSGISGDGNVSDEFVKPHTTITFEALKPCHILFPSASLCGNILRVSIGVPDEAYDGVSLFAKVVTDEFCQPKLPKRHADFHKGLCGFASLFCGSYGYSGAAVLAAKSAVRCGAGIVNCIIPDSIYPIIGSSIPEAICTPLKTDSDNILLPNQENSLISAFEKSDALLIGCGLGRAKSTENTLISLISNIKCPLVLDADGINILSNSIDILKQINCDVVLTPHPAEAARILGVSTAEVQNDRYNCAKAISKKSGAVTVLKGAKTLIATPTGDCFVVFEGNAGMASAGTGDMLAGMIVAFLAQGLSGLDAALCGTFFHAKAGDLTAAELSVLSMTPSDMIDRLHFLFSN